MGCLRDKIHRKTRDVLYVTICLLRGRVFEGTLLDMAKSRAHCAFGLELDIFGNDLGAVPYENLMNRSPISPNGPIAMGINA